MKKEATKKLTRKQKKFVDTYVATGNGTKAALEAYDAKDSVVAKSIASENLTKPYIQQAVQEALPDELLGQKHRELLQSTKIEHLVFPLGPADEDDYNFSGGRSRASDIDDDDDDSEAEMPEDHKERTSLTDKEIIAMLAEVNCKVRRIVHGETARHVYFWAADNRAVKDALDMAYKLKGSYAPEKRLNLNMELPPNDRLKSLATKLNAKKRLKAK